MGETGTNINEIEEIIENDMDATKANTKETEEIVEDDMGATNANTKETEEIVEDDMGTTDANTKETEEVVEDDKGITNTKEVENDMGETKANTKEVEEIEPQEMNLNLQQIYGIISDHNGKKLCDPYYDGVRWRIKIECCRHHAWSPSIANLLSSHTWCPYCYGNVSHTIQDLHNHAILMGGKCLSIEYHGIMKIYKWQCGRCNEIWEASWNNIRAKHSWCPHCKTNVGEEICRAAFEEATGKKFPRTRPFGFELDGFCTELNVAFEYDGIQHRIYVPYMHKSIDDFESQRRRDANKNMQCADHNVLLLRIPDNKILPFSEIRKYCCDFLTENNIPIVDQMKETDENFMTEVFIGRGYNERYLNDLKKCVAKDGSILLTERRPTRTWPLKIRCPKNHEYGTTYDNFIRGRRCPQCAITRPKTDNEINDVADSFGCIVLSIENRKMDSGRSRRFITVRCNAKGHIHEYLWDNFKRRGCQICTTGKEYNKLPKDVIQNELTRWTLELLEPFTSIAKEYNMKCITCYNEFSIKWSALERYDKTRDIVCPICFIRSFLGKFSLNCTDVNPSIVYDDKLNWVCTICYHSFSATVKTIQVRKNKCPNGCTYIKK